MLCHGLTDYRDGFVLPALAGALASAGVSSLRIDLRGNGESEGKFEFANMRDEVRPCTWHSAPAYCAIAVDAGLPSASLQVPGAAAVAITLLPSAHRWSAMGNMQAVNYKLLLLLTTP